MKTLQLLLVILCSILPILLLGNEKEPTEVKNVIILIPDGTSSSVLTLSRWYKGNQPLAVDPYICGFIKTYCSDGRFPDSAPTSTAYATGVKTKAPFIGIDENSNPRVNVLELAKQKGIATGIVTTCEFPHATPADFVCHFNNRESGTYPNLAKQFIYNSPTLVFTGGKKYLDINHYNELLKPNNISLITSLNEFNSVKSLPEEGNHLWGLFSDWQDSTRFLSFECDRNPSKAPGLSQMAAKAINLLSQNKKGFFMMIEGSQIDWASHYNDPFAIITDYLEFDKAVNAAIDFAKKDGHTVVIVCPDHANGGFSLGNSQSNLEFFTRNPNKYDNINIKERITDTLSQIKWSGRKLAEMMMKNSAFISSDSIQKYYNLSPTNDLLQSLTKIVAMKKFPGTKADTIQYLLGRSFSNRHFIGWTTTGHTADDVFLAIYAPAGVERKQGVIDNSEIGRYIADILNLGDLDKATGDLFCKHTDDYFKGKLIMQSTPDSLVIKANGKVGYIDKNTNLLNISGRIIKLPTVAVYLNNCYYIPKMVINYF